MTIIIASERDENSWAHLLEIYSWELIANETNERVQAYIFTFGDAKIGFFLATIKYMFLKLPVYLTQPCCVFTVLISHIVPT